MATIRSQSGTYTATPLLLAGFALSPANAADRVWSACFAHGLYHLPSVLRLLERHGG